MISHHRLLKSWLRPGILARGLVRNGHQVTMMVVAEEARFHFKRSLIDGVDVIEAPDLTSGRLRSCWDPTSIWRRLNCVRRLDSDYDLIHLFETRPATIYPGLAARRRLQVPMLIDWIDWWGRGGLIEINRPAWYRLLFGAMETYYEEHFRTLADANTVMCHGLVERAVGLGVPRETILHLRNGADHERFCPRPMADVRTQLGLAPDAFIAGFASLDSFYDLEPILRGMKQLLEGGAPARLLLIGKSDARVRHRVAEMGLVEHTDFSGFAPDEIYPLYLNACDVLLMPFPETNYNIGRWPNKFGEYLASGRPVIFNAVGDLRDFDLPHGEAVGIACEFSAEAFAASMQRLYDSPELADRFGGNARRAACRKLDWSHQIERLESLYADLTNSGRVAQAAAQMP
jgi:glycosyltransferase involved in cell wall biosynthesis